MKAHPEMQLHQTAKHAGGRIGIIGNMNNNGFALLRYFRDLGADAYLLPFASEGVGALSHFSPEADTWDFSRWSPYVRQLPISDGRIGLVGDPFRLKLPPRPSRLRAALADYDQLVGSGGAPALAVRAGRRLNIFFPYSVGIEMYNETEFVERMRASRVRRLVHGYVRRLQARGVCQTLHCLNAELSVTREAFERLGKPFHALAIPMVYNREPVQPERLSPQVREAIARMRQVRLPIFAAARHYWVRDPHISEELWPPYSKNSDWLIRGFAEFVRARPNADTLLTMVEYGKDVEASKALIEQLGLAERTQWLPILPRREIMALLDAAVIGAGQFYTEPGALWAGTGWETLAAGRPLLHRHNFTAESYRAAFGHDSPEVLDVQRWEDVATHLAAVYENPQRGRAMGEAAAAWFEEHGGIGLARRWLALLEPTGAVNSARIGYGLGTS